MEIYIAVGILIFVGAVIGYAIARIEVKWWFKKRRKESSQNPKYIPASKTPRGGGRQGSRPPIERSESLDDFIDQEKPISDKRPKIPTGKPSFFECTHPKKFTAKDICESFEEGYSGGFESGSIKAEEITEFVEMIYEMEPSLKKEGLKNFDGYFVHFDKVVEAFKQIWPDKDTEIYWDISPMELFVKAAEEKQNLLDFCGRFVGAAKRAEESDEKIKITELVNEAEKILKEIKDGR